MNRIIRNLPELNKQIRSLIFCKYLSNKINSTFIYCIYKINKNQNRGYAQHALEQKHNDEGYVQENKVYFY